MEEEEDVILEGSPLHEEFKQRGLSLEVTSFRSHQSTASESVWPLEITSPTDEESEIEARQECEALCERVATQILNSSLLVVEDEDFITNFVLSSSEDGVGKELACKTSPSSSLGSMLLYSCSIAAVAGTLILLSDRTRVTTAAATTALASLVPAGIAALTSGPSLFKRPGPSEDFLKVLSNLLEDMKVFKVILRKTLNLLQGMELLQRGSPLPPINSSHGGLDSSPNGPSSHPSFPVLRSAAYACTLDLIRAYRTAIRRLLTVSPCTAHIDHQEHYIAFVDLEHFNIKEPSSSTIQERVDPSIKSLKDIVQLALIQQSEYLRRFSLTFCAEARDNEQPTSRSGVLKQIHELSSTIKKLNKKLSSCFEYHQALGMSHQSSGHKKPSLETFVPLKSIYTSLFSSGLHLQNSLLKVRELEKVFESMDIQRRGRRAQRHGLKHVDKVEEELPNEDQLIAWLHGFKEIQKELEACLGCLDEGSSHVHSIQKKPMSSEVPEEEGSHAEEKEDNIPSAPPLIVPIDDTPIEHIDEVFEAVMDAEDIPNTSKEEAASILSDEELRRRKAESLVLDELKSVLSTRSLIQERREAEALAKKKGLISPTMNENEIQKAIDSQVLPLSIPSPSEASNTKCPNSIQSVNIEEELIKNELAKVLEEINDIEEEIIQTEKTVENGVCLVPPQSSYCLSSSSDSDCSSNCSRDTVKSFRENSPSLPPKEVEAQESREGEGRSQLSQCLRSISTPDLHSVPEGTSQYRTMESITSNDSSRTEINHDRDSESGSADEMMENRVLKVYRRPLRPAALKKKTREIPNGVMSGNNSTNKVYTSSSYLSKRNPEDLVIPSGAPPPSLLGSSTNSFVSQIRAKAAAFKVALKDSEKVFGD